MGGFMAEFPLMGTGPGRLVLGEVCLKRLQNPALDAVFPGYAVSMRGMVL